MSLRAFGHKVKARALQLWYTKNLILYLFFVGVATIFWFLHSLGKEYAANVNVQVDYHNFPLTKEPKGSTTQRLTLNVTAYGFSLIRMQLKSAFYNYKVDVGKLKKHKLSETDNLRYELSISAIRNQFEGQLGSGIVINSVFPEDVDFSVRSMSLKKVPIRSSLKLELKSGYMLAEKPIIKPDSVTLKGSMAVLDKIKEVYTEEVILDDVSSSFRRKLALKSPGQHVELLAKHAVLDFEIQEYIEEEKSIPILPLNFPDSAQLVLQPSEVKLRYRTYAEAKRRIKDDDFVLVVDYNTINNLSKKIEVQVVNLPKEISRVYMTPRYVNYLITYRK